MDILYVFAKTVSLFIGAELTLMFLRAILSWFLDPDGRLCVFLCMLTEPVVAPVRFLLSLFGIGEDTAVDVGFYVAYFILLLADLLLPSL